ncbi:hypothetical protein NQ317_007828 [Molorchus minor]|uniref:Uncharacterized protein n=1 Tax=Molorchus minor TaxID=1323400 RepID=A0ABQ9K3F5_9CUCU|nr:hypothetical protein NQ317_007828 [Molorchus minor]
MACSKGCMCLLCLQLDGCENKLKTLDRKIDNFILLKPKPIKDTEVDKKKYTFFGMETNIDDNFEKFSTIEKTQQKIHRMKSRFICGYEYYSDESDDDFPAGMEADIFRQYLERRSIVPKLKVIRPWSSIMRWMLFGSFFLFSDAAKIFLYFELSIHCLTSFDSKLPKTHVLGFSPA